MSKFHARVCPNCNFYVAYSIALKRVKGQQVTISNFCLNCNYKLPVNSLVRGLARPSRQARQRSLRLVHGAQQANLPERSSVTKNPDRVVAISPAQYAQHLRAIGQDLERIHLTAFNLECTGEDYLVWVRSDVWAKDDNPLLQVRRSRLPKLWRNKSTLRTAAQEETYTDPHAHAVKRLRYSLPVLDLIESEQRQRRRNENGATDGHALSQLLRTIGDNIGRRGERLLGVSWQGFSVSTVSEDTLGRKGIDILRPDNLYDLWVKMYLRRNQSAFSDTPRAP